MPHRALAPLDFYQLLHLAAQYGEAATSEMTFDLYLRSLPEPWDCAVFVGIESMLADLLGPGPSHDLLAWAQTLPALKDVPTAFFESLSSTVFTGNVWSIPEGTAIVPGTPVVRVQGLGLLAGLWASRLAQAARFESSVATRAMRFHRMSGDRILVDLAASSCPTPESALRASRAAYIGGVAATSNLAAGWRYGIPLFGAISSGMTAVLPDEHDLLEVASRHLADIGNISLPRAEPIHALRALGPYAERIHVVHVQATEDVAPTCAWIRKVLNAKELEHVRIMASGGIDERRLRELIADELPAQLIGFDAALISGADASFAMRPSAVMRDGKHTTLHGPATSGFCGREVVVRTSSGDVLCLPHERDHYDGDSLLELLVERGAPRPRPELPSARRLRAASVDALPAACQSPTRSPGVVAAARLA